MTDTCETIIFLFTTYVNVVGKYPEIHEKPGTYQEVPDAGGGDVDAAVDEDLLQVGTAVGEREEALVGETGQSGEYDPPQGAAPSDLRHTNISHLREKLEANMT